MRRASLFIVVLIGLILLAPVGGGAAEEPARPVRVINFPALQKVQGEVAIPAPVPHALLLRLKEITVPPVEPGETGRLIDGGTIAADGFTAAVLSLSARANGRALRSGVIGAYLIPEEESIVKAFEEDGLLQFPLEVSAPLTQATSRLTATQQALTTLGFPRYRVRLYNTTDRTVIVNLYAYLTH